MRHTNIETTKSARVYHSGEVTRNTKTIWFLLHGYGQTGDEFISEFEQIAEDDTIFIAPEALNKFYLRGFYGKVGAAWMTKENREAEIQDYLNYLNSVVSSFLKNVDLQNTELNALGFSQGCETLSRWVISSEVKFNYLILCSGRIPEDVLSSKKLDKFSETKLFLIKGDNDKLIGKEKYDFFLERLNKMNIRYHLLTFDGGHEMNFAFVKQIMEGGIENRE